MNRSLAKFVCLQISIVVTAIPFAHATEISVTDPATDHWSLQPIRRPPVPTITNTNWPHNPIDRFILSRIEDAGLEPASPAPAHVLHRRLHFNLVGLPPSFDSPDIDPSVTIDRLLASPHYGIRWARHWLDVVRYADSNGLDENAAHANAWRYRDYVVRAFNADRPFDEFIVQQLAGDLLPAIDDRQRHDHLTATGFLAMGPKVLAEPDKVKMEMDIIDEQIDTIGRAFLGMTLGCARCHDHKFDPIATEDYYALAGIFKSTQTMDSLKTIAKWHENTLMTEELQQRQQAHDQLIKAQNQVIKAFQDNANQDLMFQKNLTELPDKPEEHYPAETLAELKTLRETLERLSSMAPDTPAAMGVMDGSVTDLPVFLRGDHNTPGPLQPRGLPVALTRGKTIQFDGQSSGRLELARWITRPDNPLTARVLVNRIWGWHFGRGLVATTDNFGQLGERPSHPELLDWLAWWLMDNGWSVKKLNRLILNSATYQMHSQPSAAALVKDEDNRLCSRAPLRRLEAEPLRDGLLAISGLLDESLNGYVWTFENYQLVFDHTSQDATTYQSDRRGIYLPVIRNHVYDLFELFDFPDPAAVTGSRTRSVIPPQALYLMNSPLVLRATERMANNVLQEAELEPLQRVDWLYQRLFQRRATEEECAGALGFVERFSRSDEGGNGQDDEQQAWQALCQAMVMASEFIYLR